MIAYTNIFPELTLKQLAVLQLYACGFSIKQIAGQRSISEETVNKHLMVTRKKLEAFSSSELRCIYLNRMLNGIYQDIQGLK